jgi:hypothetical protein
MPRARKSAEAPSWATFRTCPAASSTPKTIRKTPKSGILDRPVVEPVWNPQLSMRTALGGWPLSLIERD